MSGACSKPLRGAAGGRALNGRFEPSPERRPAGGSDLVFQQVNAGPDMLKSKIRPPRSLPVGSLLAAIAFLFAGCGSEAPSQPTPPPAPASSVTVSSITDGDTLRFS